MRYKSLIWESISFYTLLQPSNLPFVPKYTNFPNFSFPAHRTMPRPVEEPYTAEEATTSSENAPLHPLNLVQLLASYQGLPGYQVSLRLQYVLPTQEALGLSRIFQGANTLFARTVQPLSEPDKHIDEELPLSSMNTPLVEEDNCSRKLMYWSERQFSKLLKQHFSSEAGSQNIVDDHITSLDIRVGYFTDDYDDDWLFKPLEILHNKWSTEWELSLNRLEKITCFPSIQIVKQDLTWSNLSRDFGFLKSAMECSLRLTNWSTDAHVTIDPEDHTQSRFQRRVSVDVLRSGFHATVLKEYVLDLHSELCGRNDCPRCKVQYIKTHPKHGKLYTSRTIIHIDVSVDFSILHSAFC